MCVRVCVCVHAHAIILFFRCLVLCMLNNVNVHQIYRVSLSTDSSPAWGIHRLGGQQFLVVVYMTGTGCQLLLWNSIFKIIIIIIIIIYRCCHCCWYISVSSNNKALVVTTVVSLLLWLLHTPQFQLQFLKMLHHGKLDHSFRLHDNCLHY